MQYKRTIIETTVYTEFVEADTCEEAWDRIIHVKTGVTLKGKTELLLKVASVAKVAPAPPESAP